MNNNNDRVSKTFIILLIVFFAFCLFFYVTRNILTPFILSAFFAYLLSPLVNQIMLLGVKRWVAVVFLTFIFLMFLIFLISVIVPVIIQDSNILRANFSIYVDYVKSVISVIQHKINILLPFKQDYNLLDMLTSKITAFAAQEMEKVPQYLMSAFSLFSFFFMVPIITFFMLLGYDKTAKSLVQLVPSKHTEIVMSVLHEIDSVMGKYIRGQIIEVLFIAICSVIGLSFLGVNYALLIGIIAGLCNLIPYLGPVVGFILGVIVTAVQFKALIPVIKVACLFIVIQQTDNNIIQPVVIGQNINLSPVMMMFALLAGAEVFGFLGILLAVPVTALIKNVFFMFVTRYKKIYR